MPIQAYVEQKISEVDYVVGADECGRGCWAGPLVACAVVIPKNWPLAGEVRDSKAFKGDSAEAKREAVARKILSKVTYALVSMTVEEVDAEGVHLANIRAIERAVTGAIAKHQGPGSYGVIVDGTLKIAYEERGEMREAISIPKADELVAAVSAASILGKVVRDAWMRKAALKYPGYGFQNHKGYGTAEHRTALDNLGVCDLHRRSFSPIKDMVSQV